MSLEELTDAWIVERGDRVRRVRGAAVDDAGTLWFGRGECAYRGEWGRTRDEAELALAGLLSGRATCLIDTAAMLNRHARELRAKVKARQKETPK